MIAKAIEWLWGRPVQAAHQTPYQVGYDAGLDPEAVNPFPAESPQAEDWERGRQDGWVDWQW